MAVSVVMGQDGVAGSQMGQGKWGQGGPDGWRGRGWQGAGGPDGSCWGSGVIGGWQGVGVQDWGSQ